MDQLPRLGKRELICLLLFTCYYVVSVRFLFLWVLGIGCLILLWHSLSLPYNYSMENLVYKFKKIIGNQNFSDRFKRIINRFKRAGYTFDIMRHTACLVLTQS